MVAPVIIAALLAAAAQGASTAYGNKQSAEATKRRSKETKRETAAGMLNEAAQRSIEAEESRLAQRRKLGKRQSQSMQDTSDLVREAFKI